MNKYKNAKQNLIGKVGEEVVIKILKGQQNVVRVDDVSELSKYQEEDVDLLVYLDDKGKRKIVKVEVKTEPAAAKYGNFFIEDRVVYTKDCFDGNGNLLYRKGQRKQGWGHTSKADYFFWYVEEHKKVYALREDRLKEYIRTYYPKERQCNNGYNIVYGKCVPIEDLCDKCKVKIFEVEQDV